MLTSARGDVQFGVLGPVAAVDLTGRPLPLGAPRRRALLAALLLRPRSVVPVDRLIELLWDGSAPPTAATMVHAAVAGLRGTLNGAGGPGPLVTRDGGYALDIRRDQLDAERFEELLAQGRRLVGPAPARASPLLAEALGLWRGPALDGVEQRFARDAAGRWDELRLECVEQRVAAELALGRHAAVVADLEELVARHPFREPLCACLVLALYRCGRQADALARLRAHRRTVIEELGLEPGPRLRQLERAVLEQRAGLEPAAPPSVVARPEALPAPVSELVGRVRERADVVALVRAHRLVTVTGPGGMGKTRLALEVARQRGEDGAEVRLVDLAALSTPALVAEAVGQALGIRAAPGRFLVAAVAAALAGQEVMIVLDSCEHLVAACAEVIEPLLAAAAGLRVLATVPDTALDLLEARLHGRLVRPADGEYDDRRAVFNAMVDRRPAAIVRCRDATDVVTGIAFAREHDLVLAVRGGGHSVAGNAVCDGGLLLDLSGMRTLHVDPVQRLARAGPGLTLGDLDRGTQQHGLATPLGVMSGTGIAGLTLGGGLGWLNGCHGLTCDNLAGAELVTADGELVQVGPDEHPDLYWAIRGGGGNFGVVTEFTYHLHPVGPVLAGSLTFPAGQAHEVLRGYDEVAAAAPDELTTAVSLGLDPSGDPAVSVTACWSGPVEQGDHALRPLRALGTVQADTTAVIPYVALQSAPDAGYPRGRRHFWKSGYLRHITDAAVDVLLEHLPGMPSPFSGIGMQQMHGAAGRVPASATAFPHRADQHDLLILSQWADPADTERNIAWTRDLFEALRPHLQDAVYVNNLGTEGPDRVRAAYGANHPRLARVKQAYDPGNVFRLNHNITPER